MVEKEEENDGVPVLGCVLYSLQGLELMMMKLESIPFLFLLSSLYSCIIFSYYSNQMYGWFLFWLSLFFAYFNLSV